MVSLQRTIAQLSSLYPLISCPVLCRFVSGLFLLYDIELSLLNNNICSIPWITIQPLNNSNKCSSISFYNININNNNNKHLKFKLKTLPHLHRYFSKNLETCHPELAHCAVDKFPLCMMIFELEELVLHVPSHKSSN